MSGDPVCVLPSQAGDHPSTIGVLGDHLELLESLEGLPDHTGGGGLVVAGGRSSVHSSSVDLPEGTTANSLPEVHPSEKGSRPDVEPVRVLRERRAG